VVTTSAEARLAGNPTLKYDGDRRDAVELIRRGAIDLTAYHAGYRAELTGPADQSNLSYDPTGYHTDGYQTEYQARDRFLFRAKAFLTDKRPAPETEPR
jgi:hypothetical protein